MHNSDTIAAISTALGEGGIAIIRVSGSSAADVAARILKRKKFEISGKLYLTRLIDNDGNIIDRVLAVNFTKPKTYTGEDIVEIHTHGGIFVARLCLELLLKNGARLAEPGEFTRRAFLNGRIDLSQAEGVLGVIKSRSIEALRASARTLTGELSESIKKIHDEILKLQSSVEIQLDFPEGETLDNFDIIPELKKIICEIKELLSRCSAGMIFNNGARAVIAGSPNVGKSSLLNALLGKKRAIVTDIAGTTRDIIEDNIIINGLPVIFADTAGLRNSDDIIEAEGVRLASEAVRKSDICLYVVDSSREITQEEIDYINSLENENTIIIFNKSDLKSKINDINKPCEKIHVSAKNQTGIEELKNLVYKTALKNSVSDSGLNVSVGQLENIRESLGALNDAYKSAKNFTGEDITADMLNSARLSLMRVLGLDAGDELLDSMFSRFCVGK